jgi:uncharacterized protein
LAKLLHMQVIGRAFEMQELQSIYDSNKSELVAVLGRRRVGKTYLIRNYFAKQITFEFVGILDGTLQEHMERFAKNLGKYFYNNQATQTPKNWYEAFDKLELALLKIRSKKKKVIFLDDLPWMGTSHISFKKAFSLFWNSFASNRGDIVVIFSGSSNAWIHNKIFKDRGGLFQRVTKRIHLAPFTLAETAQFLKSKNLTLNKYAVLDAYMILGGIPFYLELIKPNESITQAIDRLFFKANAELRTEFTELFKSLFNDIPIYKQIVEVLAKHTEGLYRNELLKKIKTTSGGQVTSVLEELDYCGFISTTVAYGNKNKDKKFKLTDAYTMFYNKFVKDNTTKNKWAQMVTTQKWISWSGIAFETVCKAHIPQIKEALKITGILSTEGAWYHKGNAEMSGAQIDLLIDRADKVITICEIKFYNNSITLTKEMAAKLKNKIASFSFHTGTKKSLMPVLISPHGLVNNIHSNEFIQKSIDVDDLLQF